MSAKHTPGPWTLDAGRMILGPCFTGELKAIVELVRGSNPREADANAHLIAAAPDLLAALKMLLRDENLDDDDPALIATREHCHAIIAKATQS